VIEDLDEHERESVPIENSHLLRGRCSCGAVALHVAGRRPQCGECIRREAGAGQGWAEHAGRYTPVVGYPLADVTAPVEAREPYPAPEFTSRDAVPDGVVAPAVVTKLAERAVAASWSVSVGASRGRMPHASHGRPGAVKTLWAVRMRSLSGAWGAYAVHDGAGWSSVMLWGAVLCWFPLASVTDLYAFVDSKGEIARDPEWIAGIRSRVANAEARTKARAACNRGVHPLAEFTGIGQSISCPTCGNSWMMSDEPWRAVKAGKTEAM
jgi:hypothetical protein